MATLARCAYSMDSEEREGVNRKNTLKINSLELGRWSYSLNYRDLYMIKFVMESKNEIFRR